MPEYPDIVIYLEALEKRIRDRTLDRIVIVSPFLLRTVEPPVLRVQGKKVVTFRRLGKRICIGLEDDLWLVLHLMVAGRLHWKERAGSGGAKPAPHSKRDLATFQFDNGNLSLTEAGKQRRASLHVVEGEAGLSRLDPGGLEIFPAYQKPDHKGGLDQKHRNQGAALETFAAVLRSENHTLKRALTDPHLFSGIGNAYSDEIFFEAQLSPIKLTHRLTDEDIERLYLATRATLTNWVKRLRAETGAQFPEKVTAFRAGMAVHGRYREPCPRCGNKIRRIRYATNETNYCANCQTGGKLLADRALSRLLREDWPKTPEELG